MELALKSNNMRYFGTLAYVQSSNTTNYIYDQRGSLEKAILAKSGFEFWVYSARNLYNKSSNKYALLMITMHNYTYWYGIGLGFLAYNSWQKDTLVPIKMSVFLNDVSFHVPTLFLLLLYLCLSSRPQTERHIQAQTLKETNVNPMSAVCSSLEGGKWFPCTIMVLLFSCWVSTRLFILSHIQVPNENTIYRDPVIMWCSIYKLMDSAD